MIEEERPGPTMGFAPAVLDTWGVADLQQYIAQLQVEIARAAAAIERRQAHRGAADAIFRKPAG